ncbi:hypothetical protein [Herbidospora sp. RD11066]
MSPVWEEIKGLVQKCDLDGLAARLPALTGDERADVAARLPGLFTDGTAWPLLSGSFTFGEVDWVGTEDVPGGTEALMTVGAATISGAAAAVTWLMRSEFHRPWSPTPDARRLSAAISGRPEKWRADLVTRLVRRIRRTDDDGVPLALGLLRETEVVPPDHEPLLAAWLAAEVVVGDPLTPRLLPQIFEAAGAGRALVEETLTPEPSWWLALTARALPRATVLDGCVSRFLRGGEPADLRFFVRLHHLLDPSPEESAPRLRDYLRLLPSAPGPVADLAATQVRRSMPLEHADLVEAVEALTFRPEAKMASSGLRWLARSIRTSPETAGDFVGALTTAYAHTSFDVRDRATGLTLKHADLFADHAETIREAIPLLTADHGARLAARFGGEALVEAKEFPPLPEVPEIGRFPAPTLFPDEPESWVGREGWLARFVEEAATDRDALRSRLDVPPDDGWYGDGSRIRIGQWQALLATELVTPSARPEVPQAEPQRYWEGGSYSTLVRPAVRGEAETEQADSIQTVLSSGTWFERGHFLEDDAPLRTIVVTWTSDEGPTGAVAHENGEPVPMKIKNWHPHHGFRTPGTDDQQPDSDLGELLEKFYSGPEQGSEIAIDMGADMGELIEFGPDGESEISFGTSEAEGFRGEVGPDIDMSAGRVMRGAGFPAEEIMPLFVLDDIWEELTNLGVRPDRVAAMRAGAPVPPPGPGEPFARVTVGYHPPRLRSFQPAPPPPDEERRRRNRMPYPGQVSPCHEFLIHRHLELLEALRDGRLPPVLLATPTWLNGHLDPDVLVDRLEVCAAAGVEPLPADLAQALLRLPRGGHPAAAERAAAIGSAAARSATVWLAGEGMPDPEVTLRWTYVKGGNAVEFGEADSGAFDHIRLESGMRAAPTGHPLIDDLLLRPSRPWRDDYHGGAAGGWPSTLPSHREVVAAHFLPFLLGARWGGSLDPVFLDLLTMADGPVGETTDVMVAVLLATAPAGTIPLVLRMAAAGDLRAEGVGRQLALLVRRTWIETRAVVAALTGLADQGGHRQVWTMLRVLLPQLLPRGGRRVTVADAELVAFAAEVAAWTGAREEIPGIREFAGSRRKSRFVHECRRLHAQLTGASA